MTSIEWLTLQGVRSFSPNPSEKQIIKFSKPLTIILGPNGSGKTTIIEALKNACTGILPPNSNKGQYWIHDPKVAGDSEVKAQIRLQFRAANKKQMVVVRSYQLTMKQKKREFKQLEAAIQTRNDAGEVVSQSYRCTDIDKWIPECMGVSKAVLENVIFCHQEDVNWPLSESSALKKKFDDIFASTRYTKALDSIKKLKLEYTGKYKDYQGDLNLLQETRSHAKSLQDDLDNNREQVEKTADKITKYQKQIDELDAQIRNMERISEGVAELRERIRTRTAEKNALEQVVAEIYDKLDSEITEQDEDMKLFVDQFYQQLELLQQDANAISTELSRDNRTKSELFAELQKLRVQEGALQSEERNHQQHLEQLSGVIRQLAERYNIEGFSNPPFTNDQVLQFQRRMEARMRELRNSLDEAKRRNRAEDDEHSRAINQMEANCNSLKEQARAKDALLEQLTREERSLQSEASSLIDPQIDIEPLQQHINTLENDINRQRSRIEALAIPMRVEETKDQIAKKSLQLSRLSNELTARQTEQEAVIRLKMNRNEKDKNVELLRNSLAAIEPQINQVFEQPPNMEILDVELKNLISQRQEALVAANKEFMSRNQQLAVLQAKLDAAENQVTSIKRNIQQKESQIKNECPDGDFITMLNTYQERERELRDEVSMIESLKMCYERFIKHSHEYKECPVCERTLNDPELSTFDALQRKKLEQTPRHLQRKRVALQEAEQSCSRLQRLTPVQDEVQRLKAVDLPKAEKQRKELNAAYSAESDILQTLSADIEELKLSEAQAKKLEPEVDKISRLRQTIANQERDIAREEARLRRAAADANRSYDDVQNEQQDTQRQLDELNALIEELRNESDKHNRVLTDLNTQLSRKRDELNNNLLLIEKRKRFDEQLQRLANDKRKIESESMASKAKFPALLAEIKTARRALEEKRAEHKKQESEIDSAINEFVKAEANVRALMNSVHSYVNQRKHEAIAANQTQQAQINTRLADVNARIEQLTRDYKSKTEKLNKQDQIKRNIDDNMSYRAKKRELEAINQELITLQSRMIEQTGQAEEVEDDLEQKRQRRQRLQDERSKLHGKRSAIEEQVKKIETDLKASKYKGIEERYKSSMVKLKTTEIALSDLEKYYSALDQALMKYHSMKMAEINEIAKELWQKTYRGQDIDTIAICADNESNTESTSRRSYKYRVVMQKGDVSLDMRGRCSAGQKVLASLIIRLALAEAFCIDCGVLALDEPTQNLDIDNVNSLAEALQTIINDRRQQSNFQLVVITHDEEFVQRLGRSEFVDYYYRVSKDPQTQHSMIAKMDFKNNN